MPNGGLTPIRQGGNRLELLAANDVVNKAGGIIKGRDVSITAINGDVLNERTVSSYVGTNGNWAWSQDFADSAARIEAVNNLSIDIGRDFNAIGSVTTSGGELKIQAGRDINIVAAQDSYSIGDGEYHDDSSITQLGSQVTAGRALSMIAGRDVTAIAIASDIDAKRDITMAAGRNLTLASAADEEHSYTKGSSVIQQADHVSQVGSTVKADGNVALTAGQDLSVIASRITAGKDAYLVASNDLNILAAQDSDYTLYDMKKKGGFGSKKTQRDEVTQITHVGSEITTGGNLTLESGGDQRYQVAKLNSGNDLTIESGGAIAFEGVKDLHDESHTKSKNSAAWFSSSGKGTTDETLRQTRIIAKGEVAIRAVDGLRIDIKQVDQQSVSETIDAMVQADPQLGWLKDAEKRGDVDWRQVKEIHESFKYDNSGLGPAAQIVIAILMSFVMGPAGLGLVGAGAGGAIATSVATTAVTSTINNKGDLGAVLKDMTSSDSLKSYALSGIAAGFVPSIDPTGLDFSLQSLTSVTEKVLLESVIKTAIMGGSFKDNLAAAAVGTAVTIGGAIGADKIGNATIGSSEWSKIALHATLGGVMAEAMGGDFRTGALAAGANEVMVSLLADSVMPEGNKTDPSGYQAATGRLMVYSQLIGVLAATITRGDADIGAAVAANATEYNYLKHLEMAQLNQELVGCDQRGDCDAIGAKFFDKHQANEKTLAEVCKVSKDGCIKGAVEIYEAVYGFQSGEYPNELDSRGRDIQAAFHLFNLDARSHTTGSIIAPTAEQFMAAMGLDPNNPNVKVAAGGLASIVAGKVGGKGSKGLGSNSTGKLTYDAATKSWASPGGLVYGQGSAHGNRVMHVLDHTVPNSSKPVHSLFSVDRKQVIGLVDDAWASRVGPGTLQANGNRVWVVDMGRQVGTSGQASIQIVVRDGTTQVITAFPK